MVVTTSRACPFCFAAKQLLHIDMLNDPARCLPVPSKTLIEPCGCGRDVRLTMQLHSFPRNFSWMPSMLSSAFSSSAESLYVYDMRQIMAAVFAASVKQPPAAVIAGAQPQC